jgi:hypothetical protein
MTRATLKDARPVVVADLERARVEPSRGDDGSTAGSARRLFVIGICYKDITATLEGADVRHDGYLRGEAGRCAARPATDNGMTAAVRRGQIAQDGVVAADIAARIREADEEDRK